MFYVTRHKPARKLMYCIKQLHKSHLATRIRKIPYAKQYTLTEPTIQKVQHQILLIDAPAEHKEKIMHIMHLHDPEAEVIHTISNK